MRILSVLTTTAAGSGAEPPGPQELERMGAFVAEMKSRGVLIDTGGRTPNMLELTIARKNGATTVTDGPFAEAKEIVGGYALLEVKDRADAIDVTKRFLEFIGNGTCHLHEVEIAP